MKNEENVQEIRVDSDTETSTDASADELSTGAVHSEADTEAIESTTDSRESAETVDEPTLFDEYEAEYPESAHDSDTGVDAKADEDTVDPLPENTDDEGEESALGALTEDGAKDSVDTISDDTDTIDKPDEHTENKGEYDGGTDSEDFTYDEFENDPELLAFESKKDIKEEKPKKINAIFDFVELFVFTLAAVFIITSFFFKYSIVDGDSMQNTLQHNDKLLLWCFMYEPECGDIVVLEDLSTALKKPIVKRVIAVGGQTVRFTRDAIYVDGVLLDEPYVYTDDYVSISPYDPSYHNSLFPADILYPIITDVRLGEYYEVTVPEGELFVMGDHRNNSSDSRVIGTVHEDSVLGKVVLRFAPSFEKFD